MNLMEWSKSSVDYARKLVDSAVEGARDGENEFLKEELFIPHIRASARHAVAPVFVGTLIGAAGGYLCCGRRYTRKAVAGGLLGGIIGFSTSVMWDNRQLAASVGSGAWKKISKTRDEHWFEKNPIDYA